MSLNSLYDVYMHQWVSSAYKRKKITKMAPSWAPRTSKPSRCNGRCLHSCVRVEFQPEQAAVHIINARITGALKGSPHIVTTLSPCTGMSNVITMLSILNRKRHHFIKWRPSIFHLKVCIEANYHRILGNMVCSPQHNLRISDM